MERSRNRIRSAAATWLVVAIVAGGLPAAADEYDPQRAAHPIRILAYALHPIGVILDILILRPAHWLASREGLDEFFGHEEYDD